MCKGCEAHKLTISILQTQLDRLEIQNKDLSKKLDVMLGVSGSVSYSVSLEPETKYKANKGIQTWSDVKTKLEAADMKRLKELERMDEA